MARIKMRCGKCGKKFSASSARQVFCPECEGKLRSERTAAKSASAKPASTTTAAHAPKIVGPGASILVPGMATSRTSMPMPPEPGELPGSGGGSGQSRDGQSRAPRDGRGVSGPAHGIYGAPATLGARPAADSAAARPRQETGHQGERTQQQKVVRQARAPKAPRPAPPVLVLTDDVRAKIEERYLALAQPVEFDGIRTQIAAELGIPKALVKKAVIELRARMELPSWWELQTYTGGNSDLDRIRRAYAPHLPVPPIGIHKAIAQELGLETGVVYQGIKRIRAEMRLPRFNPPALHEVEPAVEGGNSASREEAAASAGTPAEGA